MNCISSLFLLLLLDDAETVAVVCLDFHRSYNEMPELRNAGNAGFAEEIHHDQMRLLVGKCVRRAIVCCCVSSLFVI